MQPNKVSFLKCNPFGLHFCNSIQDYVITVIEELNKVFSNSLARDDEFSGVDEVQGLFLTTEDSYIYFRMFYMLISPVEI